MRALTAGGAGHGVPLIRVAHLITDLSTGGAQRMLQRLLDNLEPAEFENHVICLSHDKTLMAAIEAAGTPVHAIEMAPALPSPAAAWRLYGVLRRLRPDILQTWLYHSDLLGLAFGRLAGVPRIVWNIRCADTDEMYRSGRNAMVLRLLTRLSRRPDAVIANSHAGREVHEYLGYCAKLWRVLPNGFDTARFKPDAAAHDALCRALSLPGDSQLVGLVGRFDPLKDHATFLGAAAICAIEKANAHFVLVGNGIDNRNEPLVALIRSLDLEQRVHLLGERDDVAAVTAGLDVATCSSIGEGFPNVIGEAMACGVPVVATEVGDSARLLGEAGVLVAPADPKAFAEALLGLLDDTDAARRAMGTLGRRRIEREYSISRIADEYQHLYRGLSAASLVPAADALG
jgi:glycosyltransferase involved in cell wall biosynthesis